MYPFYERELRDVQIEMWSRWDTMITREYLIKPLEEQLVDAFEFAEQEMEAYMQAGITGDAARFVSTYETVCRVYWTFRSIPDDDAKQEPYFNEMMQPVYSALVEMYDRHWATDIEPLLDMEVYSQMTFTQKN